MIWLTFDNALIRLSSIAFIQKIDYEATARFVIVMGLFFGQSNKEIQVNFETADARNAVFQKLMEALTLPPTEFP